MFGEEGISHIHVLICSLPHAVPLGTEATVRQSVWLQSNVILK